MTDESQGARTRIGSSAGECAPAIVAEIRAISDPLAKWRQGKVFRSLRKNKKVKILVMKLCHGKFVS